MRAPILLSVQSLLVLSLLPRSTWAGSPQTFPLEPPDDETPVVVKTGFYLEDIDAVQGALQFNEVYTGWWVQMVLADESRS